jgi:type II secretory pathway pseudopilin PulG
MTTTATLDPTPVALDPGGVAAVPLQIHNSGSIVEGYSLEVVGPAGGWASVEPAELTLYPDTSTTATVMFFPPRSAAVPAGPLRYGVRVVPTEHPEQAVVPEGSVEVLPFNDTTAELVPRTSHGRRGARVRVAVDNRGNLPVTVGLRATDQAESLDFDVRPAVTTVDPGHASFVDVRVRPHRLLWRGQPKTLPYTVLVDPRDGTSVTLDGTHVQDPVIPRWLPKALLLALALLAALAALWLFVLKGTVESAAQEAAQEQVQAAEQMAEEAEAAAEQAGASAGSAQQAAGEAVTNANKAADLVGAPALPALENPFSDRLEVTTDAADDDSFPVPDGATLRLTDIVLSNPQGDFGRVLVELGDRVLLDSALENFRDLDYHFITPIVGAGGDELTMTVQCDQPGAPPAAPTPPTECETSMYFGGVMVTPQAAG